MGILALQNLINLKNLSAVADIIYRPSRTPLLLEAEKLGLPNLNGGGMLLYQGTAAFSFWTEERHPRALCAKHWMSIFQISKG